MKDGRRKIDSRDYCVWRTPRELSETVRRERKEEEKDRLAAGQTEDSSVSVTERRGSRGRVQKEGAWGIKPVPLRI